MNKKTIRIAGWALGLSMAIGGIGAAVSAVTQKESIQVNATDYSKVAELDLTTKAYGTSNYYVSTTYGDWTIVNGANNNKQWAYFKMGGKSATLADYNPCYIYSTAPSTDRYDKIEVHLPEGSLSKSGMSVNSWGLYVYSDSAMTRQVDYRAGGTITNSANTFTFTPSSEVTWAQGSYYKVLWDLSNTTTTNGIVCVDKISCYKESEAIPVTGLSLGDAVSLHKGQTLDLADRVVYTPENTTQTGYTLTENSSGSIVSIDGTTLTAAGPGDAVVTITSTANPLVTNTLNVHVGNKIPTNLYRTKFLPISEGETFNSLAADTSNNKLKVKYSDDTEEYLLSYEGVTPLLAGEPIAKDYAFATTDTGKSFAYRYSETVDGVPYTVTCSNATLSIAEKLSISSVTNHFANDVDYLLKDGDTSYFTVAFKSYDGEPVVSVSSSQEDVLSASAGAVTYNSSTYEGSFNVTLDAKAIGVATLTVGLLTEHDYELSYAVDPIVVRSAAPVAGVDKYVRLEDTGDLVDGRYLIVCEGQNKAFNGGLTTLDATNNNLTVSHSAGEISYTAALGNAEFTITASNTSGYYIQSSSGYYIGRAANSNGMDTSTSEQYENTIEISAGVATIAGTGGRKICFNADANQQRFRYMSSGGDVQLYKFEAAPEPTGFDKALKFVNDYMHTDVSVTDAGTGLCKSSGWYSLAKAAFFDKTDPEDTGFHLAASERLIVKDSFSDYYRRLQQWALANDEEIDINDGGTDVILKASQHSVATRTTENNNTALLLIGAIMGTAAVAVGLGIGLTRKRKED